MSSIGSDAVSTIASRDDLEITGQGEIRHTDSDENELSSLDSQGQRPGRFYGPDSSWRFYTRDERGLAASLDQADNNDLSLQLYNLHAFKAALRDPRRASAVKAWQSKQRWTVSRDPGSRKQFQPRPKFSAWPLKPSSVPRSSEIWGAVPIDDDHDHAAVHNKNPEQWKPSLHLQEELKAVFLRQAKEQFLLQLKNNARPHESARDKPDDSHKMPITIHDTIDMSDATSSTGSSVTNSANHTNNASTSRRSDGAKTPEFMADDELAGVILQPTVRHLLSKQDDLLRALHLSRRGQQHNPSAPWLKQRSSRHTSPASAPSLRPGKETSKRNRGIDNVETKSRVDRSSAETTAKQISTPSRKRSRKLGPRDWSEVLGMAAMLGWNQSTIDRAARRCAALFEEGMSMRFTAGEISGAVQDKVVDYLPDMVPTEGDDTTPDERSEAEDNAFYCPYLSCERHEQPYVKRWRLREHLRRKHDHTNEEIERLGSQYAVDAPRSVIEISSAMVPSSSEPDDD